MKSPCRGRPCDSQMSSFKMTEKDSVRKQLKVQDNLTFDTKDETMMEHEDPANLEKIDNLITDVTNIKTSQSEGAKSVTGSVSSILSQFSGKEIIKAQQKDDLQT